MSTNPTTSITISTLPPPFAQLKHYNLHHPTTNQHHSIPKIFLDAMLIRQSTFVEEQKLVALEHHINAEDGRSFHFIAYSCDADGNEVPIGSLRVLPPPNEPRPHNGSVILSQSVEEGEVKILNGEELFGKGVEEDIKKREEEWEERNPTDMWDGKEWFLQFGRMCVLKEWRGKGVADLLVKRACQWAEGFRMDVSESGSEWKGLLLANAREEARRMWERNGFVEDKAMGRWNEVGVELFAICRRVEMKNAEVEE